MRPLRLISRLVVLLLILIPFGAIAGLVLALDTRPSVDRNATLTPDSIARAKRILEANDPRSMRAGRMRTIAVTPGEAGEAVNYVMNRYANGSAQATFEDGRAQLVASVHPPGLPSGLFLNLRVTLREGAPFPSIERVRAGSLPVPVSIAESVLAKVFSRVFSDDDRRTFERALHKVEFNERGLVLVYEQQSGLADTLRQGLMSPDEQERLRQYNQRLVDVTKARPNGEVSLVDLLAPLFALAAERSRASNPILENRAAILVLTAYVNGRALAAVVPEAARWPRPKSLDVTLNGRHDSAQHFTVSAMLASNTGGPFADAVGLYKEIADSRGGSGFSFNDLGADKAGSRLGQLAENPQSASRLQTRVSAVTTERAIIPDVSDLAEGMSEAEFTRRFGGVGAPAYNRMIADIESRIAALPAFR